MRKFLVLLVLTSLLLGVSLVMADSVNQTQNTSVDISHFENLSISPSTISFGSGFPGDTLLGNQNLSFDADHSNVDLNVIVSNVQGKPFNSNLSFDGVNFASKMFVFNCTKVNDSCSYSTPTSQPGVTIPSGFRAGTYTGNVTFSVNSGNQTMSRGLEVSVNQIINVEITPPVVNFGSVIPGNTVNGTVITFDASNSNVDLVIISSSVTGKPFEGNLKFNGLSVYNVNIPCIKTGDQCDYESPTVMPTLRVPVGFVAGTANGVITYTITGSVPI